MLRRGKSIQEKFGEIANHWGGASVCAVRKYGGHTKKIGKGGNQIDRGGDPSKSLRRREGVEKPGRVSL